MAWARVVNTPASITAVNGASPFTLTLGAAIQIADRVIVLIATRSGDAQPTITSVTDSLGHTYTEDARQDWRYISPGFGRAALYSAPMVAAGTPTITVTWTRGTVALSGAGAGAVGYRGLSTDAQVVVDAKRTEHSDVQTTTPATPNVASTSAANELVIGGYADNGVASTYTTTDGATRLLSVAGGASDLAFTEKDSGAQGSKPNASGSLSGTASWAELCVVYYLAGAIGNHLTTLLGTKPV